MSGRRCLTDPSELLGPIGPEVSCEECFDLLDRYLELNLKGGEGTDTVLPGMRNHLRGCPPCREDCESLRAFVASDPLRPDADRLA